MGWLMKYFTRCKRQENKGYMDNKLKNIMVIGVGNVLLKDEGFGIHVVKRMQQMYEFPENVELVDGGVLGVHLLGIISKPDYLIVVDVIRSGGRPGDMYRIEQKDIPERIRAKNSVHQVDFLEALTLCLAMDHQPQTVILGVEPEDIETLDMELTATTEAKVGPIMDLVLAELKKLGVTCEKGTCENVSCDPLYDRQN
jgi:hydrogenase maturation protease